MPTYTRQTTETVEIANEQLELRIAFRTKAPVAPEGESTRELRAWLDIDLQGGAEGRPVTLTDWLSAVPGLDLPAFKAELVAIRNHLLGTAGLTPQ